jgi:hypothetical protein
MPEAVSLQERVFSVLSKTTSLAKDALLKAVDVGSETEVAEDVDSILKGLSQLHMVKVMKRRLGGRLVEFVQVFPGFEGAAEIVRTAISADEKGSRGTKEEPIKVTLPRGRKTIYLKITVEE